MTRLESGFAVGPWPSVVLVQVTLVALLGLLAWLTVRRGGSALRGAILLGSLVGLLIVPGLAAVAPVWLPVPAFAWLDDSGLGSKIEDRGSKMENHDTSPRSSTLDPRPSILVALGEPLGKPSPRLGEPLELLDEIGRPPEEVELDIALFLPPEEAAPPVRSSEPPRRPWSLAEVLVVVWLFGALAFLMRALAQLALLYRWARRARPVRDKKWIDCLQSLAERYGLPAVALRESPAITSPLTLGLFRPVILLPTRRRTWSAELRNLILAHELAHVRRHDFLAGLVAEVAACLCWFHPLVRWLASRLRLEQEYTADAWAVSAANDAMNYVRCLARLALELGQERGSLAPAFWRRRPEILRRIDMLRRNPHGHSPHLGKGTGWTVAVLAAAACVAIAGVGPLRSVAEALPPAEAAPEVNAPAIAADVHGDPLPEGALARLGTTRWRHGANITFVAFGPEGQTLITAGQDNTARLWDLATGKEIRRFARPQPATITPPGKLAPPKKFLLDDVKFEIEAKKVRVEKQLIEAETAKVAAEKAALEAVILQRVKLAEIKPAPTKVPDAVPPVKKDQNDGAKDLIEAQKAQAEKQRLAAEKAAAEAEKAKLEIVAKQLAIQRGDTNSFTVAVAPDGKTLATANATVIQLYEVETGKELRKIDGLPAGMVGLLFSPDGQTLAARNADGALTVWETATGKMIQQIKASSQPNDRVTAIRFGQSFGSNAPGMAFAPDGNSLAVATTEFKEQTATSSVKIWDVVSGKETGLIKGPEGEGVSAVALAPAGKLLAYAAANTIYLCEPDTGKELRQIKIPDGVTSLAFAPDGKSLAVRGRSQQVRLWETATGKELYQLGDAAPPQVRGGLGLVLKGPASLTPETRNLAFSPDGKRIATASGSTVRLWDGATGKELLLADSHQGPLAAVALSADGKSVVSWGSDGRIRRWEAATGKPLHSFKVPSGTTSVALSADGQTVALANADNTIRLHETATGKELHQIKGRPTGTAALAFAPDGKTLAARGSDSSIRLYDVARGSELRPITAQVPNNPAAGEVVLVKALGSLSSGSRAGLVFSPDGKLLASPGSSSPGLTTKTPTAARSTRGSSGTTDLYDVTTGKLIRKIESSQPVVSCAFSPDGRVLATENADQSITLWEVASGKERAQLGKVVTTPPTATGAGSVFAFKAVGVGLPSAEPAGPVTLAFSPDGRALATRGPDLSVRIWDVVAGKEMSQLKGHEGRVETIAFAPDGKTVSSGSADTTILLWDAATLMKDFPKPALAELPDQAVEPLWSDLAGEDASKALQSILKLVGAPNQAVPFLSERLKPAAPIAAQQLERWIADLESDKYTVRQEASANLLKAGEQVVPALQKLLTTQPTIETRKRAEELLDKLTGGTLTTEQLRLVRAVEAFEQIGTTEARGLLRTLAQGAPGALPTREAQAALDRLAR